MPTATTTFTTSLPTAIKTRSAMVSPASSSSSPATMPGPSSPNTATLRSMYNRAAKAFLNRDISLTNSLLHSAFSLISSPPTSPPLKADPLDGQRRKWDILRITMETTLYASPRNPTDPIPQDLRELLIQTPHSLVQSMYARSLELFTPALDGQHKRDSAYLPSQVLVTLIYSTLKLDCPDVGRKFIEEWLARWGLIELDANEDGGYDKVVELYCLQVLPKVQDWAYAREFLDYETQLAKEKREALKTSLHSLHEQYLKSIAPPDPLPVKSTSNGSSTPNGHANGRSHSPAPSSTSTSSSLSTTSTHTAVPSTPRDLRNGRPALQRQRNGSSASISSTDSTATATPRSQQRRSSSRRSPSHHSSSHRSSLSAVLPFRSHIQTQQPVAVRPPSAYSLIKAFLQPYLTTSKFTTFFVLFIVFPLVSLFFRIRGRRRLVGSGPRTTAGIATADLVRRRLQAAEGAGMVGRVWGEVVRAVLDTVKMGGSGLV